MTYTEDAVLALLKSHTYEEVRSITGWSRGKIYALAMRTGSRKTEQRIRERAEDRRKRQQDTLEQLLNTTAKADVLDFLDGLPDNSVALHFTSPPYNLGKKYGDCPSADVMRFTYFHGWMMQIISEMARTLRPGGVICLNVGKTRDWENNLMPLDVLLFEDLRRSGLSFQSRVVWTINHGLTPKARLSERNETILVFSKGEQSTFNPTPARTPQKHPSKRAFKGERAGDLSGNPLGAFPSDVWSDINQVAHNHPDASHGRHPAQFPVRLVKRAVMIYTLPGDLVCDCFNGSGSTSVACVETGRPFVGADLFYEDLRGKRLAVATADSYSPLPGISDEGLAVWQAEVRRVDIPQQLRLQG
jgi:DNA modification methylase